MKLSIVIPAYNEKDNILKILKKVESVPLKNISKEIIIVDDCSTDGTRDILKKLKRYKIVYHEKNGGKGTAIRTGLKQATGDIVIIQDADMEYNPNEYVDLLQPILRNETDVVYGSRFIHPNFKPAYRTFYLGNVFLSLVTRVLYFRKITDMETCYKMFRRSALKGITLHARGFDLEPEITAKFIKKGLKIVELPVSYHGRPHSKGKKLKPVKDGLKALWYLLKYRFVN